MRKLFRILEETLRNGEDCVLVTVVASSGSTPRGAGACMLVTTKGRQYGTIGGGAVEYRSEQMAQGVLETKQSGVQFFQLRKNEIQDLGMICGGDVHVYFRYIAADNKEVLALAEAVEDRFQRSEPCWLISEITTGQAGPMGLYSKQGGSLGIDLPHEVVEKLDSKAVQAEAGGKTYYCEKLVQSGTVYIFGGGHVAQALVPALAAVGFRCVVLEDREDFCRKELFPGVAETMLIDNERVLDYVAIGEDDYVVVMTRGHKNDQTIQAQALGTPACYIGVIGSRKKAAGVFANLRALGFSDEELGRVTTPIGLDIKGETPEEIAVSVTAQLILVRATRGKERVCSM